MSAIVQLTIRVIGPAKARHFTQRCGCRKNPEGLALVREIGGKF